MDWDKLRIFHAVSEAGSFTHAGDRLNLIQSSVSRQISRLEEERGVPLFHRHARGLKLTEQIDRAVSSTLTRTIYTSGTTLMPLFALIFFGGSTLFWFAIALALGVVIGSWSSIALAPSLLSLSQDNEMALLIDNSNKDI